MKGRSLPTSVHAFSLPAGLGGVAPGIVAFGVLVPLASVDGGYFATSWGWTTLLLTWVAALAVTVGEPVQPSALEAVSLLALIGFVVWTLVSLAWSDSAHRTLLEGQRGLVYIAGLLAALVVVRGRSCRSLLEGTWAAIAAVSLYSLATRLFPDRIGSYDPFAGARLSEPLGYWNALGVFAAMGLLLALGIAAHGRKTGMRVAAAASTPLLVTTLYFTFSRGGWAALGIGLVAALVVERRRLALVTAALVLSPWIVLSVWAATASEALNRQGSPLDRATEDGGLLAFLLLGIALCAIGSIVVLAALQERVSVPPQARFAYAVALGLTVVVAAATAFGVYGSPWTLASRGYTSFTGSPPDTGPDLSRRLFQLSSTGRVDQWEVAWRQYEANPWLGSGAGTYDEWWAQLRPSPWNVKDAHGLYIEQLAEVGPLGLALLLVALGAPLLAVRRARREPLAAVALGAYAAYLAHAGADWDWELPAVTLAAVFCGAALLVSARGRQQPPLDRRMQAAGLVLSLVLGAAALAGLVGNRAIAATEDAVKSATLTQVEDKARRARSWAPWSSEPWRLLGDARYRRGDRPGARSSYLRAIEKSRGDWLLWYDLALASDGRARRDAYAEARRLNPYVPELP